MTDGVKQRFLELLGEDLATLRKAFTAWEKLEKDNARLEDFSGKVIASATEVKETYRRRERELLELIERVRSL